MSKSVKKLENDKNGEKCDIFGQNMHVWPPGVTANVVKGGYKVVHFIRNMFNFIPNAGFWVFDIFKKPKTAKNWYFSIISDNI